MKSSHFVVSRFNKDLVVIKSLKDKQDGTTDACIEYSEEVLAELQKSTGKKRITKEELSKYVESLIEKATNGTDGYILSIQ